MSAHQIDILSNGFKFRNSDSKGNGVWIDIRLFC